MSFKAESPANKSSINQLLLINIDKLRKLYYNEPNNYQSVRKKIWLKK